MDSEICLKTQSAGPLAAGSPEAGQLSSACCSFHGSSALSRALNGTLPEDNGKVSGSNTWNNVGGGCQAPQGFTALSASPGV